MKKQILFSFVITFVSFQSYSQQGRSADSLNNRRDTLITADKTIVLTKVEVESHPEDKNGWQTFLKKNINYDIAAFNDAPVGKYPVKIKFTVFSDGHLGDFIALTKFGYGMEREVIHALKKSPNWTPAFQNGKAVNAYRILPITFVVE